MHLTPELQQVRKTSQVQIMNNHVIEVPQIDSHDFQRLKTSTDFYLPLLTL